MCPNKLKMYLVVSAMAFSTYSMSATDSVTLTFNRTGSSAANVQINATGINGVTATLDAVSPAMKTSGSAISSDILCPDVNGNSNPTITFLMTVKGLPASFTFNTIGLDIHAFNASGAYQSHEDNKIRQWNVDVATGASESALTPFATLSDIDIADGVNPSGTRHQLWYATSSSAVNGSGSMTLKLTVTKGTTNEGCFFGLSSVTLSTGEVEPEPPVPPEPPVVSGGKIYTIKWKNNTSNYMTEASDGGIVISNYSTSNKIFWEFIPTDNEDCFYIRNTASGLYIGSCNMTPSSASKVKMSATPVEYYVHQSASTSGENRGCWWLSSTDCANYNNETSGARCLNKDGASTSIITWTSGLNNIGSYWTLTESEDLYEPRPFTPAAEIGKPNRFYHIISATDSRSLTHSLNWVKKAETDDQNWYFVGENNLSGGYQIVKGGSNEPINSGARYKISDSERGYTFTGSDDQPLTIDGVSEFTFTSARSQTARNMQIYSIPCGSVGKTYITQVIGENDEDFFYPMSTIGSKGLNHPLASKPTNKYTILSRDAIIVPLPGKRITVKLNSAPSANTAVSIHFDEDFDGVFERTEILTPAQEMAFDIDYPESPKNLKNTRMRIRVDENGVTDPEADVCGQILDLRVQYLPYSELPGTISVGVNDPTRGTATTDSATLISAKPKGTSLFLYWAEGHRIISLEAEHEVAVTSEGHSKIIAYFSPNLEKDGIDGALLNKVDGNAEISVTDRTVRVIADSEVSHIFAFALNGTTAASNSGSTELDLSVLPSGVYIVKAITATGIVTAKIII